MKNGWFGIEDIIRANKCRLFLKAVSVVDIATGDGRRISEDSIHGI